MPIGEASCRTYDENGLAVWTIRIGKQEIPGRWVIVDREFRPHGVKPQAIRAGILTMVKAAKYRGF